MRSRLVLAVASAVLSVGLPAAAVTVASQVAERSGCEELDCLGPFLLTLLVAVPVVWLLWAVALRALGQRLPWLVPVGAALSAYLLATALPLLPGQLGGVSGVPELALCAAAWAAALGPRRLEGYGDLR